MNWEQLSPRDRLLAVSGGGILVLVLLYLSWSWYSGLVTAREAQISSLDSEITKRERKVLLGKKALKELHAFRERSLPSDKFVARSVYQEWLLARAEEAKLKNLNVSGGNNRPMQFVGQVLSFNLKAEATLPQIVSFLESIERQHYLHRMTRLSLKPGKDKIIDLSLSLEAVAVEKADAIDAMPTVKETRLRLPSAAEYMQIICNRNFFYPKNLAPKFTSSSSQTATLDREFSFSAEAKDPDADQVSYELLANDLGASFDPKSGKLRWTPRKTGRYEFKLKAKDNGWPSAETMATLTVNVEAPKPPDPPPMKPVEGPKKLAFDQAKYTVLVAVLVVDEQPEVWLLIRPTGQTLKLREGDPFEVGSVKGLVVDIGPDDFVFEVEGRRKQLGAGEILEQAKPVSEDKF